MEEKSTMTQAREKANNILESIESVDSKRDAITNQCSSMLLNLIQNGEDQPLREKAIDMSTFFNESFKELKSIDSKYIKTKMGEELDKWTEVRDDIDLIDYVPNSKIKDGNGKPYWGTIDKIKDGNGIIYPSKIKDLNSCFLLFKKWIQPKNRVVKEINFTEYSDNDEDEDNERRKENFWEHDKRGMFLKHGETESTDSSTKYNINDFYYNEYDTKENQETLIDLRKKKKEAENFKADANRYEKEIEDRNEHFQKCLDYVINHDPGESLFYYWRCKADIRHYMDLISLSCRSTENFEKAKKEIKKLEDAIRPTRVKGSYYDDDYLVQRDKRKIHTETIRMVVNTYTTKDGWGRVHTHNTYDNIVKKVEDYVRQTVCSPLILLEGSDDNIIAIETNDSFKGRCLLNDLEAVKDIGKLADNPLDTPDFFKDLACKHNDFFNNEANNIVKKTLVDSEGSLRYVTEVYSKIPKYLYYENENGRFMLAKVLKKEIVNFDPVLKEEYKKRYNLCVDKDGKELSSVKFFVYDDEYLEDFYKNFKYKINIYLQLEYSNLDLGEQDIPYIPCLKIGDSSLNEICKVYKDKIVEDLKDAKKHYEKSESMMRCEDGEPFDKYRSSIKYLESFPIDKRVVNNAILNSFINYCDGLLTWSKERSENLVATIDNKQNIDSLINIIKLRLSKNSGSLLIWYQSLINFDDSYINDYIKHIELVKDTKSMLVTTACTYKDNEEKLSNYISNPDYIDIEDINDVYGDTKFKKKDIFIFREKLQHKNTVIGEDEIYVKVFNNKSISEKNLNNDESKEDINNLSIPKSIIETKKVTRLKLKNPLPSWCKTNDPKSIIICQSRT